MRVLEFRTLTSMAIAGACAFVAAKGSDIVGFSIVDSVVTQSSQIEVFKRWIAAPVLGFSARFELTPPATDDADLVAQQRDELLKILSVRPLSSGSWLSLLQ